MDKTPSFLSVSEINRLLKLKIAEDDDLHNLTVKGEISSWKSYPSATYFDIKDDKSTLSCILWSDAYLSLPFEPKLGDEVLVSGYLDVYIPRGRYSLMANHLELFGQGSALLALEALKKKLLAEGLFDEARKRLIPAFPKKIGIIVGKDSAAEADLLKNCQRRWPLADLYFFYSLVQGKEAPASLLKAFQRSQSYPLDVLIIARGGGSNEDLSAFNDESFARAVAGSKMPTISAIGHEIDFSIVDAVADKRVSTPTGAAEAATPSQDDIRQELADDGERLKNAWLNLYGGLEEKLNSLATRPFFKNPSSVYAQKSEQIGVLGDRLYAALKSANDIRGEQLKTLDRALKALNPYGVLGRGYSLSTKADGTILHSVKDVAKGDEVSTRLKDGIIHSKVE